MKKTTLFLLTSVLLFSLGIGVFAQNSELPNPGLTPGNPFYFLESITESIGTFFTFGELRKAERYAALANERVAEIQAVAEKVSPKALEKAFQRYDKLIEKALAKVESAEAKGKDTAEVSEKVAEATAKHLTVLEGVLEKVPEQAKTAITKALEVSQKGHDNALRALARERAQKATELNLKTAEAKLNKANKKADEGETEEAEEAVEEFENQQKLGEEISQIAQGLGEDTTTIEQLVGKATSHHLEILAEIYEKVPEQAKSAIEKAMTTSIKGHEKVVEALQKKDAIDNVPEEVPMPDKIPAEVRNRVRQNAKER